MKREKAIEHLAQVSLAAVQGVEMKNLSALGDIAGEMVQTTTQALIEEAIRRKEEGNTQIDASIKALE